MQPEQVDRAFGCWLGQLSGDALGSMVEFQSPEAIRNQWPHGLRVMASSPFWQTMPGQPTDDSEMAMELAYALAESYPRFDPNLVAFHYRGWMESGPFDCGKTISRALTGHYSVAFSSMAESLQRRADPTSQANGALMRQSPLGIWGYAQERATLAEAARQDARLTHPHPVCQEASAVYVTTLAAAIAEGLSPEEAYRFALDFQRTEGREEAVLRSLIQASEPQALPPPCSPHIGYVLLALHNAFYQLLHCPDLESVVVETVMLGGDADTNAAIAGALAGAVHGEQQIPDQWRTALETCRPSTGLGALKPRPERYWPGAYEPLVRSLMGSPPGASARHGP